MLIITKFANVNNPFKIKPLSIGRVILVFIILAPASERKRYNMGRLLIEEIKKG